MAYRRVLDSHTHKHTHTLASYYFISCNDVDSFQFSSLINRYVTTSSAKLKT